jgi:RNA recognition motif-containing protein
MTRIFVGNVSYQTTDRDLRSAFERYGRVSTVSVPMDRSTGRPRGIAFVSMPSLDDADEAITRMNGATLGGRRLTVNEAEDKPHRAPSVRDPRWDLICP